MLYGDNFYNATNEWVSKIIRVSWVTVREGHQTRSKDWQRGKREIAGHDAVICISPRLTTNIFRLKILFTHPLLSTLTYDLARDLDSVRMHQYAKYLGQRSFRWKVIVLARQLDRRIQTGDRSSAWPLKWSVRVPLNDEPWAHEPMSQLIKYRLFDEQTMSRVVSANGKSTWARGVRCPRSRAHLRPGSLFSWLFVHFVRMFMTGWFVAAYMCKIFLY